MKRSNPTEPPYLSFCLIIRNCAATLETTLQSIRARAPNAEIVCVDTCSRTDSGIDITVPKSAWPKAAFDSEIALRLEGHGMKLVFIDEHPNRDVVRVRVSPQNPERLEPGPNALLTAFRVAMELEWDVPLDMRMGEGTVEIAQKYADVFEVYRGPRGDWTPDMGWFDDAAAARNRSFALAHGTWKAWIDSDDELPESAEVERLLTVNGRLKPGPTGVEVAAADGGARPTLEDILRFMEKSYPDMEVLWAPYLYRMNPDGTAAEWQDRERFVRNHGHYHWAEQSHEVLVSKSPTRNKPPGYLAHFLFVHRKRHTPEDSTYAVQRHFDVLMKKYNAGEKSTRVCLYLENYARFMCPERRGEFIRAAYEGAVGLIDRYRALQKAGEFAAENGFLAEAMEHFSGAINDRPELPDAYVAAADALDRAGDYVRAARFFADAVKCRAGAIESFVPPRQHLIHYKLLAALEIKKSVTVLLGQGAFDAADACMREAVDFVTQVATSDAIAGNVDDRFEAQYYLNHFKNELEGLKQARAIYSLWDYLVRNDETQKAEQLREIIPHNLQDHPAAITIELWGRKIRRHLSDEQAYADFYNNDAETGCVYTEALGDGVQVNIGKRAEFVVDYLREHNPTARILEIGCNDGSTAIPILKALPGVTYVGVDANRQAIVEFKKRFEKHGLVGRNIQLVEGMKVPEGLGKFDAVLALEVIEHVPDPTRFLEQLDRHRSSTGRIFVSTPWGAYDRGYPAFFEQRDPRGHVRAMTIRDVAEAASSAHLRVEDIAKSFGVARSGADLGVVIASRPPTTHRRVTFAVPASLWEWNASEVLKSGIGASEETIVFLARELAKVRQTEVFGPVPFGLLGTEEGTEVRDAVAYWPRQQFRLIDPQATVIVSRSPESGVQLDEAVGTKLDKILWLQDTHYDELNAKAAEGYRKIVVLTDWHKRFVAHSTDVPVEKLTVIPNFLLAEHFRKEGAPKRAPHHFIYASSPDRGLIDLLKMWPRILERWSDATLDVFYGWRGCIRLSTLNSPGWVPAYKKTRIAYQELRWQKGIREFGMVSHAEIAREMQHASVWAYPTSFAETFCSNAIKARAAGCFPVTTPYAGLAESAECPWTTWVPRTKEDVENAQLFDDVYVPAFIEGVEKAFEMSDAERTLMSADAIERYRIETVLPLWEELLK